MRVCQKCSSEVRDGAKICRVCGAIVESPPAGQTPDEPSDADPADGDEPLQPQGSEVAKEEVAGMPGESASLEAPAADGWACPACRETIERMFDRCWNCGTSRDGTPDPDFKTADELALEEVAERHAEEAGFSAAPRVTTGSRSARTVCPDCEGRLQPIRLIERAGEGNAHYELSYAAADAERSWFRGRYDLAGKVAARMCVNCGRILLYGEPNE